MRTGCRAPTLPRRSGQRNVERLADIDGAVELFLQLREAGLDVSFGFVLEPPDVALELARSRLEPVVIGRGQQAVLAAQPAVAQVFELLFVGDRGLFGFESRRAGHGRGFRRIRRPPAGRAAWPRFFPRSPSPQPHPIRRKVRMRNRIFLRGSFCLGLAVAVLLPLGGCRLGLRWPASGRLLDAGGAAGWPRASGPPPQPAGTLRDRGPPSRRASCG